MTICQNQIFYPYIFHIKLQAGIKYSYGLELRPKDWRIGFMLPISEIRPTVEETWAGIKTMCMEIKPEFVSD